MGKKLTFTLHTITALLLSVPHPSESAEKTAENFLFSYFKGNGEEGLHLAYSRDGLTWKALNYDQSFLAPEIGNQKLMRDPCIIYGPDGFYHMVWTVSWNDRVIGYASSNNLITWSKQRVIPVMMHESGARNCWAPEIFYDAATEEYVIFWSTTITGRFPETVGSSESEYNHRIYCTTTRDFTTFSPTRLLYDPGFNCIDGTITGANDQYVMFFKDETLKPPRKNIRMTMSASPQGPWGAASDPITGEYWAEGPTTAKIGDDLIVYFDKYRKNAFGAVRSTDMINWDDISDKVHFPEGARHGTVFAVSDTVLNRLLDHTRTAGLDALLERLPVVQNERVYKQVGNIELKLHIFSPEQRATDDFIPAVVFFFGGGWVNGTPTQFYPHCKYLASRGMIAISAEYRVQKRHGTTPVECVKDGKSAIRWVREHARELGVEPFRIVVGGGSAGGHVGACTAILEGFEEDGENMHVSSKPNALVLFNPVTDTTPQRWSSRFGDHARALSPNHNIVKEAPPTIIFHGINDTTVPFEHAETFQHLMSEAGNSCRLFSYEGMGHGFFNYGRSGNVSFIETVREMDRFLGSLGYIQGAPGI